MPSSQPPPAVIRTLIAWATARHPIRAMVLTSTRAVPNAPVDVLSDYDVILIVQDIQPFVTDRTWLNDFGEVLVAYWDPVHADSVFGIEKCGNVTQYADGLKIDFGLWPVVLFQQIVAAPELPTELDAGYQVLLDKDHLTTHLHPPTFTGYAPKPPTDTIYQTLINDFLSDAPYVAKCLWRDDLLPAKWCLDTDMKHLYLRQMLEWRMAIDHSWSVPAGNLGKGLNKRLPPDIWTALEHTYVGAGIADNWAALARTMALFRQVGIEVGEQLGYAYPDDLHQRVCAYVDQIKQLPARRPEAAPDPAMIHMFDG
jgi:aminoglycoside 6-adenylyltransferase